MTETMLLPTDMGAAYSLREMAYAWQDDPLTTEGARSLEFLVARALQITSGLHAAWSLATEENTAWETGAYFRRVQAIDFLAVMVVDLLTRTREILARIQAKHPSWAVPPHAAQIDPRLHAVHELAAAVRKTLDWLNQPWPPVSKEMVERSRVAYDRGEGEPIGDVLARLESGGPLVQE